MIIQHFVPYNWRQEEPSLEDDGRRRLKKAKRTKRRALLRTPENSTLLLFWKKRKTNFALSCVQFLLYRAMIDILPNILIISTDQFHF